MFHYLDKIMLRNLVKISIVLIVMFFGGNSFAQTQQTSVEGYVLMKVKSDILDCPHFSVLLPQELQDKKKIELTKTDNKSYMLFKAKNYSDSTSNEFYSVINEINFPKQTIVELIVKDSLEEALELINE